MNKYIGYILRVVPYLLTRYPIIFTNAVFKKKISLTKRYNESRKIISKVLNYLKVDIIMTGLKKLPVEQSFMLTPNHQSFLDSLCLVGVSEQQTTFVAKKETEKYIFVAKVVRAINGLFLDRENLRQEIKVMQEVKRSLKEDNLKWVIFPEGTRTRDENFTVNEFKPGSLKMAMSANVNIYPVALWGSFRVLDFKENNLKKFPIFIHIFDPITPEMYKNMKTTELAPFIQNMIQNKLEELKVLDKEYCDKYSKKRKK